MGYYSTFELSLEKAPEGLDMEQHIEDVLAFIHKYRKLSGNSSFAYPFDSMDADPRFGYLGDVKWYEADDNMLIISAQFPDIVYKMHREGEESGDICVTYYQNGKMQECPASVTFDPFNPKKLA